MSRQDLTQGELKNRLRYDPDTGIFTWRRIEGVDGRGRNFGQVAGSYHSRGSERSGYIVITLNGFSYASHILAWLYVTGSFPELQIDHINGIKNDNRFVNLRQTCNSGNQLNRGLRPHNKSGVTGVWATNGYWQFSFSFGGSKIAGGSRKTFREAVQARLDALRSIDSEFINQDLIAQCEQALERTDDADTIHTEPNS